MSYSGEVAKKLGQTARAKGLFVAECYAARALGQKAPDISTEEEDAILASLQTKKDRDTYNRVIRGEYVLRIRDFLLHSRTYMLRRVCTEVLLKCAGMRSEQIAEKHLNAMLDLFSEATWRGRSQNALVDYMVEMQRAPEREAKIKNLFESFPFTFSDVRWIEEGRVIAVRPRESSLEFLTGACQDMMYQGGVLKGLFDSTAEFIKEERLQIRQYTENLQQYRDDIKKAWDEIKEVLEQLNIEGVNDTLPSFEDVPRSEEVYIVDMHELKEGIE